MILCLAEINMPMGAAPKIEVAVELRTQFVRKEVLTVVINTASFCASAQDHIWLDICIYVYRYVYKYVHVYTRESCVHTHTYISLYIHIYYIHVNKQRPA